MKRNIKKTATVTLMAATVLSLVACKSEEKKVEESTENSVLTVAVDKLYVDYINGIKGDFEKEHNVTLEVKEVDQSDVLTNLPIDGPTGTSPDVMMAPYDRVGGLGSDGHIAEVSLGNEDEFDETVKSLVKLDGVAYGEPSVIETLVLYYNKDKVNEEPKTFADLEKLQDNPEFDFPTEEGTATGFLANWTNFYYAYGLTAGYGGYAFGNNGTDPSDVGIASGDALKALEYAKSWYAMWPKGMQDMTKAGSFASDQFIQGKVGALIDGPWVAASFKEAGINYGVAKIPTLPNGNEYSPFAGGKAWVISNYSKNKEVAQDFLDYVTNSENQKQFFEETQEIPANTVAREFASEKGNDLTKAVINQFTSSKPMPNIPQMAEVWEPSASMYFDVVSGSKTPEEASADALKTIKDAIEQKYGE
ncbi:extracellular solute-binding protein [Streptococcus suis]|uniref:extracellular solute-binding protein n=1 Tax=Streptococcus parasuis TaxID=1501662 RepID=UPI001553C018|nr:extracellular solute-binding protein [Streptococcus suis]BCP64301.1 sugar ABC transporter substrate-binding protein [Streptococcus parasuis]NQM12886.1 extracellular solute-binding protein [Streptococcus suis]NQM30381.1 extracellular solute-binding protein [Streptococcus suis]NQP58848.1 extracellular solute-binding protein [Streptococcus suis]